MKFFSKCLALSYLRENMSSFNPNTNILVLSVIRLFFSAGGKGKKNFIVTLKCRFLFIC